MKRLFAVTLGLLMALSFLVPAVLSQEVPMAGYNDTPMAGYNDMTTQNGSSITQNGFGINEPVFPANSNTNNTNGQQDGFYLNQIDGLNSSGNATSSGPTGIPPLGGTVNGCIGGAGGANSAMGLGIGPC